MVIKTAATPSRQVFAKKSDCGVIERTYRPLVVGMVLSKVNARPKFFSDVKILKSQRLLTAFKILNSAVSEGR